MPLGDYIKLIWRTIFPKASQHQEQHQRREAEKWENIMQRLGGS